jgi:hypothetical protein
MGLADDLKTEVTAIFRAQWTTREGQVVPDTPDLELGNDAVTLDATVLYADIDGSTSMVPTFRTSQTAFPGNFLAAF